MQRKYLQVLQIACLLNISAVVGQSIFPIIVQPVGTAEQEIYDLDVVGQVSKMKTFYTNNSQAAVMNWLEAMEFCQINNMQPARIDSGLENAIVTDYLMSTFGPSQIFWLGGSDFGSEGKFYWQSSGDEFEYSNWYPGNPGNGNTQNCAQLRSDSLWQDNMCLWPSWPGLCHHGRPLCQTNFLNSTRLVSHV